MAILPGSLDYLYYNDILDHIPYEAYDVVPGTPSSMNMEGLPSASISPYSQMVPGYEGMGGAYGMAGISGASAGTYGAGAQVSMNGSQYIDAAKKGWGYNGQLSNDTFTRTISRETAGSGSGRYSIKEKAYGIGNGVGAGSDFEVNAYGEEGKSFRQSITSFVNDTKTRISSAPSVIKGLLGVGIIGLTLFAILKGKKRP